MPKKGEHGEPWVYDEERGALVDSSTAMFPDWGHAKWRSAELRAVACVNALDGLEPSGVTIAIYALKVLAAGKCPAGIEVAQFCRGCPKHVAEVALDALGATKEAGDE